MPPQHADDKRDGKMFPRRIKRVLGRVVSVSHPALRFMNVVCTCANCQDPHHNGRGVGKVSPPGLNNCIHVTKMVGYRGEDKAKGQERDEASVYKRSETQNVAKREE